MILDSKNALVVPAGNGTDKPLVFDMTQIYKAHRRLVELCGVNKLKAGELLHTYIAAWKETKEYGAQATRQVTIAKRKVKEARATVILDRVREVAKEKALSSNEDVRDAIVQKDEDYIAACDRLAEIEAKEKLLEISAETFKMAYFAVNKLVDPYDKTSASTSGGSDESDEVGSFTAAERVEHFVNTHSAIKPANYDNDDGFGAPKL